MSEVDTLMTQVKKLGGNGIAENFGGIHFLVLILGKHILTGKRQGNLWKFLSVAL